MIGMERERESERESEKYVLSARLDDDGNIQGIWMIGIDDRDGERERERESERWTCSLCPANAVDQLSHSLSFSRRLLKKCSSE